MFVIRYRRFKAVVIRCGRYIVKDLKPFVLNVLSWLFPIHLEVMNWPANINFKILKCLIATIIIHMRMA